MRNAFALGLAAASAVALPAQNTATFPAWSATRDGSTSENNLPLANGVSRVMMVYDKAELTVPANSSITKLGYRQDAQNKVASTGYSVQLETLMGESTKDYSTVGANFANNYTGTPVTVFTKKIFVLPNMAAPTATGTNPSTTFLSLPLDTPYLYTKTNNLVVEHKVYANNNGNAAFTYYLDVDPFRTVTSSYGAGCVNSSSKTGNVASNVVGLGGYWQLSITNTTPVAPTAVFIGVSNQVWKGLTLPFDLAPLGAPSCKMLTDMVLTLGGNSNSSGSYSTGFYTPADTKLNNATLYVQAASYDPFANDLGIVTSNGAAVTFGFPARMSTVQASGNVAATTGSVTAQYGLVSTFAY